MKKHLATSKPTHTHTYGICQGHCWRIAESWWPAASWLTEATAADMLKFHPATVSAKPLE